MKSVSFVFFHWFRVPWVTITNSIFDQNAFKMPTDLMTKIQLDSQLTISLKCSKIPMEFLSKYNQIPTHGVKIYHML